MDIEVPQGELKNLLTIFEILFVCFLVDPGESFCRQPAIYVKVRAVRAGCIGSG